MSLNLNRRHFVLGSAAVLAQMGISNPLTAQPAKLTVPTVDSLTIRVITDSSYDTPRAGGNKWVKVSRVGYFSRQDYRKALHNEWGLSLALDSKIGNDTRHIMLDFGYTPNALLNNMELLGIDGAKMQALIMSHGHFDHYGGLIGYLEKFGAKLPSDLALYAGGEDNFCNCKTASGTPGHFSDWGVIARRDLEKHRVRVVPASVHALDGRSIEAVDSRQRLREPTHPHADVWWGEGGAPVQARHQHRRHVACDT